MNRSVRVLFALLSVLLLVSLATAGGVLAALLRCRVFADELSLDAIGHLPFLKLCLTDNKPPPRRGDDFCG